MGHQSKDEGGSIFCKRKRIFAASVESMKLPAAPDAGRDHGDDHGGKVEQVELTVYGRHYVGYSCPSGKSGRIPGPCSTVANLLLHSTSINAVVCAAVFPRPSCMGSGVESGSGSEVGTWATKRRLQ